MSIISDFEPHWFGRANMIKVTSLLPNYTSDYSGYTVNSRTENGNVTGKNFIVPFEVTVGSYKAVLRFNYSDLNISIVGKNQINYEFSYMSSDSTNTRISGYGGTYDECLYYFTFPHDIAHRLNYDFYYYESPDLFVLRTEYIYENKPCIVELWVTSDGYIQYLYSGKCSDSAQIKYYKNSYISEGDPIKCTDGKCPYDGDTITCPHYSTTLSTCYYNGTDTQYVPAELKYHYTFPSDTAGKVLLHLDDIESITAYTSKCILSPITSIKSDSAISDFKETKVNKLLLYDTPLSESELGISPKILSVRVNGFNVYAHFVPVGTTGDLIEPVPDIRLRYGGTTLNGVNKVSKSTSLYSVPDTIDKVYNYCYFGDNWWEYVGIHGFLEPLENVSKVRIVFYSKGDSDNGYTSLPNETYNKLYFLYRSTFDDTKTYGDWTDKVEISVPSNVCKVPHILEYDFSDTPITVAQWVILPFAAGSGYSQTPSSIKSVNFLVNDGLSLNYKF